MSLLLLLNPAPATAEISWLAFEQVATVQVASLEFENSAPTVQVSWMEFEGAPAVLGNAESALAGVGLVAANATGSAVAPPQTAQISWLEFEALGLGVGFAAAGLASLGTGASPATAAGAGLGATMAGPPVMLYPAQAAARVPSVSPPGQAYLSIAEPAVYLSIAEPAVYLSVR